MEIFAKSLKLPLVVVRLFRSEKKAMKMSVVDPSGSLLVPHCLTCLKHHHAGGSQSVHSLIYPIPRNNSRRYCHQRDYSQTTYITHKTKSFALKYS
jgi:hypothetical protein